VGIVDDEEMVVTSLESFLQLETDYRILTSTSPVEALERLGEAPPDVVVADYLMPVMDGIQFLSEVKERFPTATRILLTGYADKENAIRAINEVGIYRYMEKPWDNEQIRLAIQNGVERSRLIQDLQRHVTRLEEANEEVAELRERMLRAFL
jgi:DNA-binding NtrC family response regulator